MTAPDPARQPVTRGAEAMSEETRVERCGGTRSISKWWDDPRGPEFNDHPDSTAGGSITPCRGCPDCEPAPDPPAEHPPRAIWINGAKFLVHKRVMAVAELRELPLPPIPNEQVLYAETPPDQDDCGLYDEQVVDLDHTQRFFSAPRFIQPSAPDPPAEHRKDTMTDATLIHERSDNQANSEGADAHLDRMERESRSCTALREAVENFLQVSYDTDFLADLDRPTEQRVAAAVDRLKRFDGSTPENPRADGTYGYPDPGAAPGVDYVCPECGSGPKLSEDGTLRVKS